MGCILHALWAAVAHTSKTIPRFHQCFDGHELRCKPDQSGIKLPRQPTPKARSVQGTCTFVCTPLPVTSIRLVYHLMSRLTGSLALSIAYGIQADTPDNEFFRMYEEMLEGVNEASVPGTFLVDVLPHRESNCWNMDCGRTLTSDGPP